MNDFFEILKYTIPALVVLAACYLTMQKFMQNSQKKMLMKLRLENSRFSLPIRLQAYERIILLLERTSVQSLIKRIQKKEQSSAILQALMIQSIRSELEHNLTQQAYISDNAWSITKRTTEENIKFINNVASKMPANAKSNDLAINLLKIIAEAEQTPNDIALELIKKEIRKLY